MLSCLAPGCGEPTSSKYSHHCQTHKARLRRHGAVDQEGVTKAHLKSYLAIVRERIAANEANPAWGKLEARWKALGEHAAGILAAFYNGRPSARWEVAAAREVARLSGYVAPRDVLVTTAAMVLMLELDPRRFRSDRAFRIQVARRVLGLTEANATTYRDLTGKEHRVYKELGPRTSETIGMWLIEAMGIAGAHIARKDKEARAARMAAHRELQADLEGLE